ncbi:MAG: glycosyltransferase [Fuerstiella sp.]|nr:hypothetical protein [Fuerstiella sp.]
MRNSWIFVGHLLPGQTSLMRMNALRRCDVDVTGFDTRSIWNTQTWLQRQMSTRLERGPAIDGINKGLIDVARDVRPTHIWFDKQEFIRPDTLDELKRLGACLVYYTPDPYFTLVWKRTRLMDACLTRFDLLVTSKSYECRHFASVGPPYLYLPLGYCDEVHRPIRVDSCERASLGFVGGWEPRRQSILEAIAAQGVALKIWGYAWDHLVDGKWTLRRYLRLRRLAGGTGEWKVARSESLSNSFVSGEVYADDYARALSTSGINIGFLRTICDDQHTTRSFEIPACGSMMLADRTDEHQAFFEEGKEAEYFASEEELIEKAIFYARNETSRRRIATAGLDRCRRSGYSYRDRMRAVLQRLGTLS